MLNSRVHEFNKNQINEQQRLYVVGDIHGDYDVLSSFLKVVDPKKDIIIFLGDYADRGSYGIEVIDTVDTLIKNFPQNVVALKGNHEDYTDSGSPEFYPCNLIDEAKRKRGNWQRYFQDKFKPFVRSLCLAVIIPGEALFVHGGISSKIRSINDLRHPTREEEIDLIWSDPVEVSGEYPNSKRGIGVLFGKDVSLKVCESLGVKRIVRSHEPMKAFEGPYYEHDGRVITISSTKEYGGKPFILLIDPKNPSVMEPRYLD